MFNRASTGASPLLRYFSISVVLFGLNIFYSQKSTYINIYSTITIQHMVLFDNPGISRCHNMYLVEFIVGLIHDLFVSWDESLKR